MKNFLRGAVLKAPYRTMSLKAVNFMHDAFGFAQK